jgi:hypothetical protein
MADGMRRLSSGEPNRRSENLEISARGRTGVFPVRGLTIAEWAMVPC